MAELCVLRLFGNPLEFLPEILPLHNLRHLSLANIRIEATENLKSVTVHIEAGEGEPDYIGRILEFFETYDGQLYFSARWYFRPEDTVIKDFAKFHDAKRVFLSDDGNDNALNCIVKKIRIVRVTPEIGLPVNEKGILDCDLYYDMSFSVAYSSFATLPSDVGIDVTGSGSTTTTSSGDFIINKNKFTSSVAEDKSDSDSERSTAGEKTELSLLDLYSGCGAMSTGLCLGANLAGVNLKTHWAVDINSYACESLKFNHPEAEVRNEKAEDFLALLREWVTLVQKYGLSNEESTEMINPSSTVMKSSLNVQLFDHRPLTLNDDDYQRVCRIPKRKGANFRDLDGVIVGPNNVALLNPNIERVLLPSGKPLVPDYAISFMDGKSLKPFGRLGRLWWDKTVPTVVTRAEPHNQTIIQPQQDRVLSIRENARLQGFPDYYRLFGPVKQSFWLIFYQNTLLFGN